MFTLAFPWRTLRFFLLLSLPWCLLLWGLYQWTIHQENEHTTRLARLQTGTLFSMIVNTRSWNAIHNGVWVRESPTSPINFWLPEKERELTLSNGERLVRVNPAYMVRQIAENSTMPLAKFRISSLAPMRPANRADSWEAKALDMFHNGQAEAFELVADSKGQFFYRYMAPLRAEQACLSCHEHNQKNDVLGGISVSLSAEPLLRTARERNQSTALALGLIGLIGVGGIGGALFQLNRKKEQVEAANRSKDSFLIETSHDKGTPLIRAERSIQIVIAEDTPDTALFLHEALSEEGYAVHVAHCGEDARALLQKINPDMALLNMRLPDMNGLDIIAAIRSELLEGVPSDLPVLVLTAAMSEDDRRALHHLEVESWLIKPISATQLKTVVRRILQLDSETSPSKRAQDQPDILSPEPSSHSEETSTSSL